jgi:putative transposase
MTKPLDGLAFQVYCRRLGFSRETQELIATVRSSPPNRNPRANHGNMPVWYPSMKMQCVIKAESHKVEFAFLLEAEYGDAVLEYYDQPSPPIQLSYLDKHGRRQTPLHTADYFVLGYHEAGWQECKPVQELTRQSQERPNRYVLDERGTWRCPPGEAFAERLGLTYRVRATDQINWVAQDNWLFLEDYLQDLEHLVIQEEHLQTLYRIVDSSPGIWLSDLHASTPEIRADLINIAIAKRQLYVDLLSHRLTDRGRTPVYHDELTARAFTHRTSISLDMGIDAHPVVIEQGARVLWDGQEWRLANVGETEIVLISKLGHPFGLPHTAFETLVQTGKMVGVQMHTCTNFTDTGHERLTLASEYDLATAVFRNRVIHPEDYDDEEQAHLAAKRAAVPERTKRHWKQLYREGEVTYGSGFIGLLPDYSACGDNRKLLPEVSDLIEEVLKTHYDTVTRKLKRGTYGEYLLQSEERHLQPTSQATFYAHAKRHKASYDQTLVREGTRAAYPYKDFHRSNQRTTSRHGSYAWSMAHIDHTELDLELFDSSTGKPMGKCWLTLMILSQPRRIVALFLSYDGPSYRSCLMALRLCVKRFGRLPTAITVDGGPEFRSTYFEKLLALYKIRKHQRPSSEPRFGSPQERLFGTMNTQFIYHLLGNTQASKQPRKMTKATDPKRLGVWTLPKLAERANIWAFEEYDTQPHTALSGMTPRETYDQSRERDGEREHKRIPYDEVFKRSTFPTTMKGTALVQPGQGVRMNHLDYWCEEMRDPTVERTQVPVRYDPFDVSIGYAYLNGQWRKCVCPNDEFSGCSERELHLVAEELRKRNRLLHGRERVELTQKQLATFRRENAVQEVILRQQQKDREARAAFAVLEGGRTALPRSGGPQTVSTEIASRSAPAERRVPDKDKLIVLRRLR